MSSVADDFGNAAAKGGGGKKQDSGRTNQLFHELPIAASMKFRRGDRRKCSGARPAICRLRARGGVFRPENLSRQNFSSAAVGFGKFLAGARGKKAISNYSMRIFPSRPEISTIFCTSP